MISIYGNIKPKWIVNRTSNSYMGTLPPFKLTATGQTYGELLVAIKDISENFIRSLLDDGELPEFVVKYGLHMALDFEDLSGKIDFDYDIAIEDDCRFDKPC